MPIGVYGADPARWLLPTYPLDWHTDLIEVLDLVARTGPPDTRMQPAVDHLTEARLPDGGASIPHRFATEDFAVLNRTRPL